MSAGDNGPVGAGANKIEIYSPPYLYLGTRPVITAAPATATVGSNIDITTDSPVTKMVLIAPMATTHATDMHQRMILPTTTALPAGANGLTMTIPADGTVPPGPYMVFAFKASGALSVARWIQIN